MSRAAYLSKSNYPLICGYWMECFKKWSDQVDRVYISLTPPKEGDVDYRPYIREQLKHPKIILSEGESDAWFLNLERLIRETDDEQLLILHDDTFIYDPDFVNLNFKLSVDKVVAPFDNNYSPSEVVEEAILKKFPNFPFVKKINRIRGGYSFFTHLIFLTRKWITNYKEATTEIALGPYLVEPGGYSHHLSITAKERIAGDLGFNLAMDLLARGAEFYPIRICDEPLWTHVSGVGYHFLNHDSFVAKGADKTNLKRLAWVLQFIQHAPGLEELKEPTKRQVMDDLFDLGVDLGEFDKYRQEISNYLTL